VVRKNFAIFAPICPSRKADHRAELIEALSPPLVGLPLLEVDQAIRDFRNRGEKFKALCPARGALARENKKARGVKCGLMASPRES
jgi:hypothetical protein